MCERKRDRDRGVREKERGRGVREKERGRFYCAEDE